MTPLKIILPLFLHLLISISYLLPYLLYNVIFKLYFCHIGQILAGCIIQCASDIEISIYLQVCLMSQSWDNVTEYYYRIAEYFRMVQNFAFFLRIGQLPQK